MAKSRTSKTSVKNLPDFSHESRAMQSGSAYVAGVDEVGRGCLAGPVVAAAVILEPGWAIGNIEFPEWLRRVRDSKLLTEEQREALVDPIQRYSVAHAVGVASVDEIDRLNILHASHLAMVRALDGLDAKIRPLHAIIDGNLVPRRVSPGLASVRFEALVKGDLKSVSVACASILAKVHRDREMSLLAREYPDFSFERHKGYPTPEHLGALDRVGATQIHRRSFAPVKDRLARQESGVASPMSAESELRLF